MRLEISNPEVAFRDCAHCRKYIYDEKTGEPRMIRGELRERVKGPPCEIDVCKKGHWSNPIEIRPQDMPAIRLYEAVQATGGACLNEAEKNDPLCLLVLSTLHAIISGAERQTMASSITMGVVAAGALGGKTK